ncbi:hypothetical protein [Marinimicrobium agarilyticum]|uniref:hypothetical protein n=1 Tax=Marinimicrobium agarilyticum TaxID=306546 RepID=UPI000424F0EA|nr:hypothetical protein [Marinimicrobium agarilyticum]
MSTHGTVSLPDIIDTLIDFNQTTIDRLVGLMESIKTDITNSPSGSLQGEAEEILRTILDGVIKTIESIMSIQEELQTRIVESFFPAQD